MEKIKSLARRLAAWNCRTFHVKNWMRFKDGVRKCTKCQRVYRSQWGVGGVDRGDKRLPR